MSKQISVEDIINVINTTWDGVDRSVLGPIIRDDVEVKHIDDEAWKPSQKMAIINMASYDTYKMVLEAQLRILINRGLNDGEK